jgi:hypothetical protein
MADFDLVAIDADGTTMDPSDRVRPRVRVAVRAVAASGVKLVLATGRALDGAQLVLDQLGLDAGLVLVNGAILADSLNQPPFERAMLPAAEAQAAVTALQTAGVEPFVYDDPDCSEDIVMLAAQPTMPQFMANQAARHRRRDLLSWLDHPVLTIVAAGPQEPMTQAAATLTAQLDGRAEVECSYFQSGGMWLLTVVAPGCNKADGLERLAARHGIAMDRVLAVADGHNDIEMVRRVGWGVAMGNAIPAVKAVADEIVADNQHDGLAEALERHFAL